MYKDSLHGVIGNLFENGLGVFFGNIPWNFTTSHIMIHHKVNGGVGDTFYLWDFDRSNVGEFMLYVNRILMHMVGYSSVKYFRAQDMNDRADLLLQGIKTYVAIAFAILAITRSFSFVFWIYLEPLLCMTYFLALINIGFHGFLEYDDNGGHVPVVDSTTIIEGEDDLFGEDDHMAHHYNAGVYFRDLPAHQKTKETEFKHRHASVFRKLSIVELSIFILFGLWEQLADHYVDYTGKMTRDEIIQMLKMRAKRVETTYEKYQEYLINPTEKSRDNLRMEVHNDRKTVIAESKKSG